MQTGQQVPRDPASPTNGQSTLHDLFALTDEQILEIEPEAQEAAGARDPWPLIREEKSESQTQASTAPAPNGLGNGAAGEKPSIDSQTTANSSSTGHDARPVVPVPPEPPAWLAAQMKDPWRGEEARELWNGVQQARQETAAYRAAFATPEDARALKELYPGGVSEARGAAERARLLEEIDRAYFGAAGNSPEQASAARAQLAQSMLRENPAAFREMVFEGLRALEGANVAPPFRAASPAPDNFPPPTNVEPKPGATSPSPLVGAQHAAPLQSSTSPGDAQIAAYAAFEKAANEDLERSVGAAIARTLEQALPSLSRTENSSAAGTQHPGRAGAGAAPLQARLSAAIRQDIETALKGDRQLGEQIAQILSARRFDNETRAQVVRLIDDRARQLVPVAAKRVLSDWTQTTLAAHRTKTQQSEAASTRREVPPASLPAGSSASSHAQQRPDPNRGAARSRAVDYRKLSDEQILEM
jgi:hypothetical protein